MSIAAIIVAAGRGERAGGAVPKQRRMLGKRPVFQWSLETLADHPDIVECILVVPSDETENYRGVCPANTQVVAGGDTRTASVLAGLAACSAPTKSVLIHDAARPGVTTDIISGLIDALKTSDAAAPALKIVDALKRKAADRIEAVDRADLYRVQTPQAFGFQMIRTALSNGGDFVDDLAAIEGQGGVVTLIEGNERLAKITLPDDHSRMERLLMSSAAAPRFGSGFDVHALVPGDGVTLCGVTIPHTQKLEGHSDADVAWHALTDAILGASALGDIGDHFPPSDPQWKGANSATFLEHAVEIAKQAGWQLTSCDVTVICEAPKVKPHRDAMRQRTADVTGLSLDAVSVKATTTEGLGFTGRGEGIAAQASAVLSAIAGAD